MKDRIIVFLDYILGGKKIFHTNIRFLSSFVGGLIKIKLLQFFVTNKICLHGKLVNNERESLCVA